VPTWSGSPGRPAGDRRTRNHHGSTNRRHCAPRYLRAGPDQRVRRDASIFNMRDRSNVERVKFRQQHDAFLLVRSGARHNGDARFHLAIQMAKLRPACKRNERRSRRAARLWRYRAAVGSDIVGPGVGGELFSIAACVRRRRCFARVFSRRPVFQPGQRRLLPGCSGPCRRPIPIRPRT
jgi:hypothetical protein